MTRRPVVLIGCGLIAFGIAGALAGAGWPGSRAADDRDVPLALRVTDARPSACRAGAARWTVGLDVSAHGQPGATLSRAVLDAAYATSANHPWQAATATQSGDALVPGRVIGPSGALRSRPSVAVVLPCNVSMARLVAAVDVAGNNPEHAQALFVDNGIAMSASSVGGVVLVLLVTAVAARRLGTREATP